MNVDVKDKYNSYPEEAKKALLHLRELIYEVASLEQVGVIEETLKWGEPSYIAKGGSTVRVDWKSNTPGMYYMYFICTTRLVETFRELFKAELEFEDNRAIVFKIGEPIPEDIVKQCISMSLRYKSIKHLEYLGL